MRDHQIEISEESRRENLLRETNAAYERLKQNEAAWQAELAERELWEQTLMDGIESE